ADTFGAVDPSFELAERSLSVAPLLKTLSEDDRQLLVWRYYDSLTQSDIAERLGVSQMSISRKLTRVLRRLQDGAAETGDQRVAWLPARGISMSPTVPVAAGCSRSSRLGARIMARPRPREDSAAGFGVIHRPRSATTTRTCDPVSTADSRTVSPSP